MTDPSTAGEHYSYMNAYWKDNTHLLYGGQGHQNFGGTYPTNYMFSGNVNDTLQWSEISAHNTPSDRRGLGSMGPYIFTPSYTFTLDFAYVFARDYNGDNLSSVALLKQYITQIITLYRNDSTPCGGSFTGIHHDNNTINNTDELDIYPNPADNYLNISVNASDKQSYTIYSICGSEIIHGKLRNAVTGKIDITSLAPGLYLIKIFDENHSMVRKFVKR